MENWQKRSWWKMIRREIKIFIRELIAGFDPIIYLLIFMLIAIVIIMIINALDPSFFHSSQNVQMYDPW